MIDTMDNCLTRVRSNEFFYNLLSFLIKLRRKNMFFCVVKGTNRVALVIDQSLMDGKDFPSLIFQCVKG